MWCSENTAQRICGRGQVCVSLEAGTEESWETHAVEYAGREAGWGTQTFWQKMTHHQKNAFKYGEIWGLGTHRSSIQHSLSTSVTRSLPGEQCAQHTAYGHLGKKFAQSPEAH